MDGAIDGDTVGAILGVADGVTLGVQLGDTVGAVLGVAVGVTLGV